MASSSKSAQTTNQTDNRRVLGEGSISAESGATVSVLDNGAINRAFDFGTATAEDAFGFARQIAAGALDFGLSSQAEAGRIQASSVSVLKNAYEDAKGRGALTDYLLIGAIAMAGIVAYAAVKK